MAPQKAVSATTTSGVAVAGGKEVVTAVSGGSDVAVGDDPSALS
jgi:hypothetical protein